MNKPSSIKGNLFRNTGRGLNYRTDQQFISKQENLNSHQFNSRKIITNKRYTQENFYSNKFKSSKLNKDLNFEPMLSTFNFTKAMLKNFETNSADENNSQAIYPENSNLHTNESRADNIENSTIRDNINNINSRNSLEKKGNSTSKDFHTRKFKTADVCFSSSKTQKDFFYSKQLEKNRVSNSQGI